jgi:phosphatidylethanolamine-binding protein (PEBP) family uncharacterized protein
VKKQIKLASILTVCLLLMMAARESARADDLKYETSKPPLLVTFDIQGGHYSGEVNDGNLFLQPDIPKPPLVRWGDAKAGKLYTLVMLDFDGNANGSWPDPVPSGENSPVRHWIVGNIPGAMLRAGGYRGSDNSSEAADRVSVVMPYRAPHIPMVSDRYGIYLFEQSRKETFEPLPAEITRFDHSAFLKKYNLVKPVAANQFVAIYVSESPFSGKSFHGNDVSQTWHQDYGKGKLTADR